MTRPVRIGERLVGPGHPCFVVAELSANHLGDLDEARALVRAAKESGADAVKLQTYTPDTLTIDVDKPWFRIGAGTPWEGRTLYDLYDDAMTPWEWHGELQDLARDLEMEFFSTPFDETAVEFLESLDVPAFKVASFENNHLPLLRRIGATGRPVILSTGMASLADVDRAVRTLRGAGCADLVLLRCTSAYPAPLDEINLRTIPHLAQTFQVVTGLSDHTTGIAVSAAAVALGAAVIERHFIRDRTAGGPDASFSLEPAEFRAMVDAVRAVEAALGSVSYGATGRQRSSALFRRSLFVVRDVAAGDAVTDDNVRVIRPGQGLEPRWLDEVRGRVFARDVERGTPLAWDLLR